jgi:hypothetical protein
MSDPPVSSYSYDSSNGVTTYYGGGLTWTQTYSPETGMAIRSYSPSSVITNSTTPPIVTIPNIDQSSNALVLGAVAAAASGAGLVASSSAGAAEGAAASSTAASGTTSAAEMEEYQQQMEFDKRLDARLRELVQEKPAFDRMSSETITQTLIGGTMFAIIVGSGVLIQRSWAGPVVVSEPSVVVVTTRPTSPIDPETGSTLIPNTKKKFLFIDPDEPSAYPFTFTKNKFRKRSLFDFE